MRSFFVSDLHGDEEKYDKLFSIIYEETPEAVFIGGDVLPVYYTVSPQAFIDSFLIPELKKLKSELGTAFPPIFMISGNDDPAFAVPVLEMLQNKGLVEFMNNRQFSKGEFTIFGYPYVPPTPFMLKDFEKYDISRYVPRDCVSPEEGIRTVDEASNRIKWSTIKYDLDNLTYGFEKFDKCLMLFHAPPYDTCLDKILAKSIEGTDEITGVGSLAIRKFIELKQPMLTMHGHIHESSSISGTWKDKIGDTFCFSAGYDGNELAVISFDTGNLQAASRILI